MSDHESPSGEDVGYDPNFVLSHRDAIHEDNWPEYEVQGFFWALGIPPTDEPRQDHATMLFLNLAQEIYGVENVYTGDAWSVADSRPLHHKPGMGIYVHPNGREHDAQRQAGHSSSEGSG